MYAIEHQASSLTVSANQQRSHYLVFAFLRELTFGKYI